jgi:hypothetical protein
MNVVGNPYAMNNPLKRFLKIQQKESAKIRKSQSKVETAMDDLLKESEPKQ